MWDLLWTLTSPGLALYLRDAQVLFNPDPTGLIYYWLFSAGFAILASIRVQAPGWHDAIFFSA